MKKTKKTIKARKRGNYSGFTLIEAMVVLVIVGILSLVSAIGFGKANRQKMVEQAIQKTSTEVKNARDYAVFGKKTDETYPCGYGIALSKSMTNLKIVYTSGTINQDGVNVKLDRADAMEGDKSCDELIDKDKNGGKSIGLTSNTAEYQEDTSLGKVQATALSMEGDNNYPAIQCLVILFSAPRGIAYYNVSGSEANCPPPNADFKVFTQSQSGDINKNFFLSTLSLTEGLSKEEGKLKIYSSGNSEAVK